MPLPKAGRESIMDGSTVLPFALDLDLECDANGVHRLIYITVNGESPAKHSSVSSVIDRPT